MSARPTDADLARALLDERDGELRENIRGDVAALAMALRRVRRAAEAAAYERAARALYDAPELAQVPSKLIDPVFERIRALAKNGGKG